MCSALIAEHGIPQLGEQSVMGAVKLGLIVLDVTLGGHLHQQVVEPQHISVRFESLPCVAVKGKSSFMCGQSNHYIMHTHAHTHSHTHTHTHTHTLLPWFSGQQLHLSPSKAWVRTLLRSLRIFH